MWGMKRIILLFVCVNIVVGIYGQTAKWHTYKHTLSFNFGSSTPSSDFGSTDYNNPAAGYALKGYVGDIAFTSMLSKHIGLALQLRGLVNDYDGKAFDEQITAANNSRNIAWTMETYRYGMASFLLGAYGMIYLTKDKKLMLDAKVVGGYLIIMHPDVDARGTDGSKSYFIGKHKKEASSFTWLGAVGLKWVVLPHMALLANIDYQAAQLTYKNFETRVDNTITNSNFAQNWATVNYTVGVGVTF